MSDEQRALEEEIRSDILDIRDVANVNVLMLIDDKIHLSIWPNNELKEQDFLLSMCKIQNKYHRRVYVEFLWPVHESNE